MIIFTATKKGTPYEDGAFTNLCCKLIRRGAGRDEGSRTEDTMTEGRPSSLGKRRRSGQQEGLNAVVTSISEMASCYVESRAVKKPTAQEEVLENYNNTLKKIKILDNAKELLAERNGQQSTVACASKKLQRKARKDLLQDLDEGKSGEQQQR